MERCRAQDLWKGEETHLFLLQPRARSSPPKAPDVILFIGEYFVFQCFLFVMAPRSVKVWVLPVRTTEKHAALIGDHRFSKFSTRKASEQLTLNTRQISKRDLKTAHSGKHSFSARVVSKHHKDISNTKKTFMMSCTFPSRTQIRFHQLRTLHLQPTKTKVSPGF